jgi:hypothetical protein
MITGLVPGIIISLIHGTIRKYSSIGLLFGYVLSSILPWLLLGTGDSSLQFMAF